MAVKTSATQEVLEAIYSKSESKFLWLGATDQEDEGNFQWIDSTGRPEEPVKSLKWYSGQPNNFDENEHCVAASEQYGP